jgi:two-component system, sporulation sensor kinase E
MHLAESALIGNGWKGSYGCGGATMINMNVQTLTGNDDHRSYHALPLFPVTTYEKLAAQLIAEIHVGIILLDECRNVVEINQAASDLLGISRTCAIDRSWEEVVSLLDLGQMERQQFASFPRMTVGERKKMEVHWKINGSPRYLSLSVQPFITSDDSLKGQVVTIENVTEIRSLELQVMRNNRLATIGQIAAGTAHEIRNPLTAIRGFLQVIGHRLKENGQQKEQGYIEIMLKEIGRISNMVGEFLLLSKPRQIDLRTVSVKKVLKEILPIIKNEALLHNVDMHIEKKLPFHPMVVADGELLKQVFLNLCKNAIEAMQDGGLLTIRLSLGEAENTLLVEVIDTGPGIPHHAMDKVFEPFYTTKENGTGLGLPICRQILSEIGGSIEVASASSGTTVRVGLPLIHV